MAFLYRLMDLEFFFSQLTLFQVVICSEGGGILLGWCRGTLDIDFEFITPSKCYMRLIKEFFIIEIINTVNNLVQLNQVSLFSTLQRFQ